MNVVRPPPLIFPSQGIIGKKVILNRFNSTDINENYLRWLNDPIVVRFSNQRFKTHDLNTSLKFLSLFNDTDDLFLSIKRIDEGDAIGTITIYFKLQHSTADIGILIGNRQLWGRGYGQDAWKTIINWLIYSCKIRKVTAGTLSCNDSMRKIFEHSGMKPDGIRRAQELVAGRPVDIIYYAIFTDDYFSK